MTTLSLLQEILATLKASKPAKEVMGTKEAADYLGVRLTYFHELRANHKIPYVHIGSGKQRRRCVYRKASLDEWLREREVRNADEARRILDGRTKRFKVL